MEEKEFLKFKLAKLKDDITQLEETIRGIDWDDRAKQSSPALAFLNSNLRNDVNQPQENQVESLRYLSERSEIASSFSIEKFSRNLRVNPGELYVYDCWIQGVTSAIRFDLKFIETVKGSGEECGQISEVEAEITMIKEDPESLLEWMTAYTKTGDIPELVNGFVEFSHLAKIRKATLQSLYKRSLSGQLGSCSFQIQSIKDRGILVVGIGPDENKIFSIIWKIGYCEPTKSMMSSFDVEVHAPSENLDTRDIFSTLQKPFLKEDVLPELWEAVVETLISFA